MILLTLQFSSISYISMIITYSYPISVLFDFLCLNFFFFKPTNQDHSKNDCYFWQIILKIPSLSNAIFSKILIINYHLIQISTNKNMQALYPTAPAIPNRIIYIYPFNFIFISISTAFTSYIPLIYSPSSPPSFIVLNLHLPSF